MNLKKIILSHKILYEFYFFLCRKKINRIKIDRQIKKLREEKNKISQKVDGLVVSLTSFGERLNDLKYTLFSLIIQTVRPEKIIVWLANGEKLPNELDIFKIYGVEFNYCDDIKSYKKLIPALKNFSDKSIVTADDDIYYERDWLKKLWDCHLKNPSCKITHIAHRVSFDKKNKLQPYTKWMHNLNFAPIDKINFPTGCGGVLYPPNVVPEDFLNENLMMKLCPNADDVWFYFMGILSGQDTVIVPHPYNHLRYVDIYKEYGLNEKLTLQSVNVGQNLNDVQIRNVMTYFGLDDGALYQLLNNTK